MRKLTLSISILFFFLITITTYAQVNQNWKWMHPKPQGNTLRYIKMFSATNMVAVGYAGTFMSTTNAGTNWTIRSNAGGTQAWGQGRSLYSGWFFNMTTGLVCGASGWLARTTNGGVTWDSLASGVTATLYGIHFINTTTGFIGGTSGTVLKSTNAGLTWSALNTGVTSSIYNIYASDVNHIYAPTSSSGVLRYSTDGGTTWANTSTGGSALYDANFINTNTGFVAGSSGHIKMTTNGGTNWTSINIPSVTSTFYELNTSVTSGGPTFYTQNFDSTLFPPTGWRAVNVSGPQTWVRSTTQSHSAPASAFINYDCSSFGTDWLISPRRPVVTGDSLVFWLRKFDSGFPPDSLCIRISTTDTAIASFSTRILYLAEGVNYPPASTWARYAVSLNAFAGQQIYVGFKHANDCGDGIFIDDVSIGGGSSAVTALYVVGDAFNIYKTVNFGANWTAIPHLDPSQVWTTTFYSMDINGNAMASCAASGLWTYSSNSGANWTTHHNWLLAGTFYDVWSEYGNGKVLAVGSGSNDTKILYSSNGGTTWIPRDIPTSKYFRSIKMINTNTGYIAGSSGAMFKTTNGGANWDSLPFPSTNLVYAIDFVNVTTGWAVSSSSPYIWKTIDGGMNWATLTGPTAAVYNIDMLDANTGYLVGTSGQVRKTTDGGTTWTAQTSNASTLYGIKMLNANSGFISGSSGHVRKTTNGGTTWDSILTPYNTTLYGIDWVDLDNGIVTGSSSGYTAKTVNGGTSWIIENTGGSTMYDVNMNTPDSAWAVGSLQGIFKWAMAPTGTITWQSEIPDNFYLAQNYPNPFNPVTTIKFGLPKSGNVSLKVYDITGRLVADLLNNAPLNPGIVTAEFDGNNYASGIYFYTLVVNDKQIDTKKMILVK